MKNFFLSITLISLTLFIFFFGGRLSNHYKYEKKISELAASYEDELNYYESESIESEIFNSAYDEGYEYGKISGYNDISESLLNDNVSYESGYEDGHEEGYDEGYDKGYSYGYDEGLALDHADGYDEGYSEGYDEGYYDGLDKGAKKHFFPFGIMALLMDCIPYFTMATIVSMAIVFLPWNKK